MTTSPSQTENSGIAARYAPPTFTSRDPLFEKMKYCNTLVVLLFFFIIASSCKAQKNSVFCGEYVLKNKYNKETLRLNADSTYSHYSDKPVTLLGVNRMLCKTSCGKWYEKGDTLVFIKDTLIYIQKVIACRISKDSVLIRVIRKSDGLPHEGYELFYWSVGQKFSGKTDSNGEIILSSKTLNVTSSEKESYKIRTVSVSDLEAGCCYEVYECDCYCSYFPSNSVVLKGKNKIAVYSTYHGRNRNKVMVEYYIKTKREGQENAIQP